MATLVTQNAGGANENPKLPQNPRMGTKTRGSCQACANVKVRCSKERPTCSRCDDRGLECEYLQSKRPGRVPGSARSHADGAAHRHRRRNSAGEGSSRQPPTRDPAPQPTPDRSERSSGEPVSSPASSIPEPEQDFTGSSAQTPLFAPPANMMDYSFPSADNSGGFAMDLDMDMSMTLNRSVDMSSVDPNTEIDWEALITQTDFTQINMFPSTNIFSADNVSIVPSADRSAGVDSSETGAAVSPRTTICAPVDNRPHGFTSSNFALSPRTLASASLPSSSSSSSSSAVGLVSLPSASTSINGALSQDIPTPCQCLLQALDLVKTLAGNSVPTFDAIPARNNNASAQRIISLNRQAIQVAMTVLECTLCTDDRFVLMALLMATTKILGRYALAAAYCGAAYSTGFHSQASSSITTPSTAFMVQESRTSSECFNRLVEIARALSGDALPFPSAAHNTNGDWCPRREDVQRVLQELHGVQRLLTQLSRRLEQVPLLNVTPSTSDGYSEYQPMQLPQRNYFDGANYRDSVRAGSPSSSGTIATDNSQPAATPLPPDVLSQMEENLRRNLYMFSAAMRDVLKNS